jgi:hypothetical protein
MNLAIYPNPRPVQGRERRDNRVERAVFPYRVMGKKNGILN